MYEAISSNKRNSYILMVFFFSLVIFVCYLFGVIFVGSAAAGVTIGIFVAFIFTLLGYYSGDSLILQVTGAKEATKKEFRHLINTVEGLTIAAGIPMPKIYVINSDAPNAFATGRDPNHSSITVTTGLLKIMNRQELEGVIAHELSHIKNYDIRYLMLTIVLVGTITLLSDIFLRSFIFGGRRNNVHPVFIVVGILLAILSPIIAHLLKLAVSRKREYLADASGAMMTRYPKGLADALTKLKNYKGAPLKTSKATAALFISNPFKGKAKGLFSTHPPLDNRIKKLLAM